MSDDSRRPDTRSWNSVGDINPACARWTTARRPPNDIACDPRLWIMVDNRHDTIHALRWADDGLSTIHSTYYCY